MSSSSMHIIRDTETAGIVDRARRVLMSNRRVLRIHRAAQILILAAVPASFAELVLTASVRWLFFVLVAVTVVVAVYAVSRLGKISRRLDLAEEDISFFRSQNHSAAPGSAFEPDSDFWVQAPIVRAARSAEFRPLKNVNLHPEALHRVRSACRRQARRIAGPASWTHALLLFTWLVVFLIYVYGTGPTAYADASPGLMIDVFSGMYPPGAVATYVSIWIPFAVTVLVLAGLTIELVTELSRASRLDRYADAVSAWLTRAVGPAANENGPSPFSRTEMVRQAPLSGT